MASAFSFGFSGDDIDMDIDDDIEVEAENNVSKKPNIENSNTPGASFPAARHALKDWVSSLDLIHVDT